MPKPTPLEHRRPRPPGGAAARPPAAEGNVHYRVAVQRNMEALQFRPCLNHSLARYRPKRSAADGYS
jgi:hypothetical protein